ncbi:MAG: hypothetical protein RRZ85_02835, partial [Gordonibacter sp.]|uniref:hypothetical protein n=1 Tax=Gordonibacter sp. TaxID=1968902 RepID=UPI002FCC92DF
MTTDSHFPHASDNPFDENDLLVENDPFERAENTNIAQVGVRPAGSPSSAEAAAQRDARLAGRSEHDVRLSFEEALAHAFDDMGPSDEAERRMLAALTAAEAERHRNGPTARTATNGKRHEADAIARSAAARKIASRRRHQIWKFAVPIAACLVLLAGVGAWALGGGGNSGAGNLAASSGGSASLESDGSSLDIVVPAPGSNAESAPGGESGNYQEDAPHDAADSSSEPAGIPSNADLVIELSTGQRLRYALDENGALRHADPALVGEALESTFVVDGLGGTSPSTPCTVHAYPDAAYPYAVRTEGSAAYYL